MNFVEEAGKHCKRFVDGFSTLAVIVAMYVGISLFVLNLLLGKMSAWIIFIFAVCYSMGVMLE